MKGNRKKRRKKNRKNPPRNRSVCYECGCLDPFYVTHGRFSPVIAAAAAAAAKDGRRAVVCGLQSLLCDLAM
jgi:hypothetical protein